MRLLIKDNNLSTRATDCYSDDDKFVWDSENSHDAKFILSLRLPQIAKRVKSSLGTTENNNVIATIKHVKINQLNVTCSEVAIEPWHVSRRTLLGSPKRGEKKVCVFAFHSLLGSPIEHVSHHSDYGHSRVEGANDHLCRKEGLQKQVYNIQWNKSLTRTGCEKRESKLTDSLRGSPLSADTLSDTAICNNQAWL
ncbi:hypothetical protein LIER_06411 [Lithospermum erythrorhizon]|uniref:Uncharacterized protein n=1 Tax=Lithospermum erythrorhizon TaxID=34254 RepID=A0AAV3P4A7_LITER